jgi:hypothetical protein
MMKRIRLGLGVRLGLGFGAGFGVCLLLATGSPLPAQPALTTGSVSDEVCTGQGQIQAVTVTPLLAYAIGDVVGGLITIPAISRGGRAGVLMSVRLNIQSIQTAEFDLYQFQSLPSAAFIDKMKPTLVSSDIFLARPPIQLTTAYSDFGSMTVYGTDAFAGARRAGSTADYLLIITKGTPTFATPSDLQLCVTYFLES